MEGRIMLHRKALVICTITTAMIFLLVYLLLWSLFSKVHTSLIKSLELSELFGSLLAINVFFWIYSIYHLYHKFQDMENTSEKIVHIH